MNDPRHLVCAACGQINRVSAARLGDRPRCGRCKAAIFDGRPVALDQDAFERFVTRNDVPVVVDFWADWCGPCKSMAPMFARAAVALEPRARLAKLDTDAAPAIAARFHIRSIPTLIVFRGGREVARRAGAMDAERIRSFVEAQL